MILRKEIEDVFIDASRAYDEFVRIDNKRKKLLNEYYSDKYNIKLGETEVFRVGSNKRIIVHSFYQTGEIDDRPEIIGRLKLPFGTSEKIKTFSAELWETMDERRGERNGNLRNSEDICDVNGNY